MNTKLSIAPMIDWSYSHFRVLMRLLSPDALVYTEMLTAGALFNQSSRALIHNPMEQPLALQLGGSDPEQLAACAKLGEKAGFQEINLNLGCPSDKVQSGQFGACMMAQPGIAASCLKAMKDNVAVCVSAKTRIGIDHQDSYAFFSDFIHHLVEAGCDKLIIHARKAWLSGLNPKQNRTIPPVQYDYVYRLKKELPDMPLVINGNIVSISDVEAHLAQVDAVMIGRLACQNPYGISKISQAVYPKTQHLSRMQVVSEYFDYLHKAYKKGENLSFLLKPIFNMAHGLAGNKHWKHRLTKMQQEKNLSYLDELLNHMATIADDALCCK